MLQKFYYSYIIRNEFHRLYKGHTSLTPKERLEYHNRALVKSTAKYRPWKLIFFAAFPKKYLARNFESYLKSGSGIAFTKKHLIKKW